MRNYEYEKEYNKGDKALLIATKAIIWGYSVTSVLAVTIDHYSRAILFSVWAIGVYLVRRSYIETLHDEIDAEMDEQMRQDADEILSRLSNETQDKFTKESQDSHLSK